MSIQDSSFVSAYTNLQTLDLQTLAVLILFLQAYIPVQMLANKLPAMIQQISMFINLVPAPILPPFSGAQEKVDTLIEG